MAFDRSATSYLLFHYIVLLIVIFSVVGGLELAGVDIELWFGVILALGIGIAYPQLVRVLGIAPEQWER